MKDRIKKITGLLTQGRVAEARQALRELFASRIPRELYYDVAQAARQANLPLHAIRLLRPIVRPLGRCLSQATDLEKIIYAACLTKIGAEEEALSLLATVNSEKHAEARLFTAFAHIARWEYAEVIPIFNAYLQLPSLNPREKIIGRLNLAAALVNERRHEEAEPILSSLQRDTLTMGLNRFFGNVLELSAENALLQMKWSAALGFLEDAEKVFSSAESLDMLFVKKWRAVIALKRNCDQESQHAMELVRKEAEVWGHWETIRDCDRWKAVSLGDSFLAKHLYFGTPFASFRKKMSVDTNESFLPSSHYRWTLGKGPEPRELNLATTEVDGQRALKPGQALHRSLRAMASDFYRPLRLVTLHHLLHPGEYFNPTTAPLKVHRLIGRLREWIRSQGLPLQLQEHQQTYRLTATGPVVLLVPSPDASNHKDGAFLKLLDQQFGNKPFSSEEASNVLRLSSRSARRILSQNVQNGALRRVGNLKATRYRLAKG